VPLHVSVVTPERELFSGEADFVLARTSGGDIGVLPGHAPYLGTMGYARLAIHNGGQKTFVAVHGGFLQVIDDKLTVLAPLAELAEELDVERARHDLAEAEASMKTTQETEDLKLALARAEARVQTAAEAGLLNF
jgi:F-type H+-transporting ATPase subunit epsilon